MLYRVSNLEDFFEVYKQWKMEVTFKIWSVISKCIIKGKGVSVDWIHLVQDRNQ
jgi:hypothetical protein